MVSAASQEVHWTCTEWLNREAALLDDNQLHEWLALLDREIDYRVPIRTTQGRKVGPGFSEAGFHMIEDFASLATRVRRLDTDFAWAEDPPSRTRRFVTNVRVSRPDGGDAGFEVRSNLLVYRGRLDLADHELIAGERQDLLVPAGEDLKLRHRVVLLDHSTLPAKNLAIFL